jgi:hypothetical protein
METERLRLRRVSQDDADFLLELVNSRPWLENIGDRGIKTQEDAVKYAKSLEDGLFCHSLWFRFNCGCLNSTTFAQFGPSMGWARTWLRSRHLAAKSP